jgi:dephospho-CoA kinase
MIKIGLTGSIGMGKSTTAQMFSEEGIPVWDADAAVIRLYSRDGSGTKEIAKIAPNAVGEAGVNRAELKALIKRNPEFLEDLEAIVHPLVAKDREQFFAANMDAKAILLDIPLLFENGTEDQMDVVVVVSTSAEAQKERVMARGTMDEDTFSLILSKQMPDAEKRKRADYVIETTSIEHARKQVQNILTEIRSR